jgi:hypothetical protein
MAKNELKSMSMGYDTEDSDLNSDELQSKYVGKILEKKAAVFNALSVEDKKEMINNAITGETTEKVKRIKDSGAETAVVVSVNHYTRELKKIKKYSKWGKNSCTYKTFLRLPLEEKIKYQNAMVNFYDKCIRESGQSKSEERVSDSSPTAVKKQTDCPAPDFDNKKKWGPIKDDVNISL